MINDLFLQSSAVISDCGLYRYRLSRIWGANFPVLFVMLNPSVADAEHDDPTIRRCIGFAKRWNCGGIEIANLFAFRATDPKELKKVADPVGSDNDQHLLALSRRCWRVVAAWGSHGGYLKRDAAVLQLLATHHGDRVMCLGHTKDGQPRHLLYLRVDAELIPLRAE